MSTMAEVIRTVLARGAYQMPGDKLPYETMAEHVAAELAAAGYGNKADAWDDQHEREITDLIKERDYLQAMCDRLAACIAPDDVLGEHSNMNDPWANALEYYASRQCRPAHPYGDSDNGPLNPIFSLGKVEDKRQPLPRGAGHE